MIRKLILFLIVISLPVDSYIIAGDNETVFMTGGDEDSYGNIYGDLQFGNIFAGETRFQSCSSTSFLENYQRIYSYECIVTQDFASSGNKEVYADIKTSDLPRYSERGGEGFSVNITYSSFELRRSDSNILLVADTSIADTGHHDIRFIYTWHVQSGSDSSPPSSSYTPDSLDGLMGAMGFYDVSVKTAREDYQPGDDVTAYITLKNTGDKPDSDSVLSYFLSSPDLMEHDTAQEFMYEVPPSSYSPEECISAGGTVEEGTDDCITVLERSLSLPSDAEKGEWKFNVDYQTVYQDHIIAFDSFDVVSVSRRTAFIILIPSVALLVILMIIAVVRRDDEPRR